MDIILPKVIAIGIYNAKNVFKNITVSKNRRVSMFEIELPIEDGGISYIGNTSAEIKNNRVIIAKPEQIRHTKLPFNCYYIHFIITKGSLFDSLINLPNFIDLIKNQDKCIGIFNKELFDSVNCVLYSKAKTGIFCKCNFRHCTYRRRLLFQAQIRHPL